MIIFDLLRNSMYSMCYTSYMFHLFKVFFRQVHSSYHEI